MRRWVGLTDVLSVTAALLVAHQLRFGSLPDSDYLVWVGVVASVTVGTFALLGLYRDRSVEPLPELGRSALATTLLVFGVVLVSFWTDVYLSRSWIALWWIVATGLVVLSRTAWLFAASRAR
jgi:FlaA1/EpsC-like NDP-sugar epimerase